jgi:hypothetical protein
LDNCYESQLKLQVITRDLKYYEKKAEVADFHVSSLRQGIEAREDLPGLRVVVAQARKAWFDSETAFTELFIAFPENEAMEWPLVQTPNVNQGAPSP